MGTINNTDILFATLCDGRRLILSRTLTGVERLSDIVMRMRPESDCRKGIYTLSVRNTTKGWSHQRSLTFRA